MRIGRVEHGLAQRGQLLDGLALDAQPDDEAGDLRRRRLAGEDLLHGRVGHRRVEVPAGRDLGQDRGPPRKRSRSPGHVSWIVGAAG